MLSLLISVAAAQDLDLQVQRVDWNEPQLAFLIEVDDGVEPAQWAAENVSVDVAGDPATVLEVMRFEDSGQPFGTMLLIDASCSMAKPMPQVQDAAKAYIDGMSGGDVASFAWFNDTVMGHQNPWVSDKSELYKAVDLLSATGSKTVLWESLTKTIQAIGDNPDSPGYRTILLLSDGLDDGSEAPTYSFERVRRLALENHVPVHAVGFLPRPTSDNRGLEVLEALAHDTGGTYAQAIDSAQIRTEFKASQDRVHNLMLVVVQPPEVGVGDHEVVIEVDHQGRQGSASHAWHTDRSFKPPAVVRDPKDPSDPSEPEAQDDAPNWALIGGGAGAAILLLALLGLVLSRRKEPEVEPAPAPSPPPAPTPTPAPPARDKTQADVAPAPAPTPTPAPAPKRPQKTLFRPAGSAPLVLLEFDDPAGLQLTLFEAAPVAQLGSDPTRAAFIVDHDTVSGLHCRFRFEDGAVTLEDLGSTNGTHINGQSIAGQGRVPLTKGDTVRLGLAQARFHILG